eukprot:GEMP01030862.1.p1 GENE.GEMP01030862.1~~GEMP01030862.1.p1  ORF type:complete len:275 (+),score=70.82 GEMP01030862.1:347-1171(+)
MAAKLGSKVLFVGKLGCDSFADETLKNFESVDINTRYIGKCASPSGVATITVEASGENSITVVNGANNEVRPADVDAAERDLQKCRVLLCQNEIPLGTSLYGLQKAKHHGLTTVFNTAPAVGREDLVPLLPFIDVLVCNEIEMRTFLPEGQTTSSEHDIRQFVAQHKAKLDVVCTLGSKGALIIRCAGGSCDEDEAAFVQKIPVPQGANVSVVDTTGAGDSFIGSLAHFLARGDSVATAARKGCAIASLTVSKKGTQSSYPDRDTAYAALVDIN